MGILTQQYGAHVEKAEQVVHSLIYIQILYTIVQEARQVDLMHRKHSKLYLHIFFILLYRKLGR